MRVLERRGRWKRRSATSVGPSCKEAGCLSIQVFRSARDPVDHPLDVTRARLVG